MGSQTPGTQHTHRSDTSIRSGCHQWGNYNTPLRPDDRVAQPPAATAWWERHPSKSGHRGTPYRITTLGSHRYHLERKADSQLLEASHRKKASLAFRSRISLVPPCLDRLGSHPRSLEFRLHPHLSP